MEYNRRVDKDANQVPLSPNSKSGVLKFCIFIIALCCCCCKCCSFMTGGLNSSIVGSLEDVKLVRICQSSPNGDAIARDGVNNEEIDQQAEQWLNQAAQLLHVQWPKGGNLDHYKEKILSDPLPRQQAEDSFDQMIFYGLPSSYLLIYANDCIG